MTAWRTCTGTCSMLTSTRLPSGGTILAISEPSLARMVETWLVRMSPGLGMSTMKYAMAKVTIGNSTNTAAQIAAARRTHFQLTWCAQLQSARRAGVPCPVGPPRCPGGGADPSGGCAPRPGRSRRGEPARPSIAALTSSSASHCRGFDGGLSNAALTSSMGSGRRGDRSSMTGGRIVVNRSSGAARRRRPCPDGVPVPPASGRSESGRSGSGRSPLACLPTGPVADARASLDDWSWCPSLFNGRAGAVARRPCAAAALRRACRAEHVRLD